MVAVWAHWCGPPSNRHGCLNSFTPILGSPQEDVVICCTLPAHHLKSWRTRRLPPPPWLTVTRSPTVDLITLFIYLHRRTWPQIIASHSRCLSYHLPQKNSIFVIVGKQMTSFYKPGKTILLVSVFVTSSSIAAPIISTPHPHQILQSGVISFISNDLKLQFGNAV